MSESVVQVKIVIRFSYPSIGGFATAAMNRRDMLAQLYDPERLERRFALFETLTLPSLQAQSDVDFQTCILIGEDLPDPYFDRLRHGVRDLRGCRILVMPPRDHYRAVTKGFGYLPNREAATHTATVRMDDDDAIHADTVGRIRKVSERMLEIRDPASPFVVGFNRGYFLELSQDTAQLSEVFETTPLGIGLALVAPVGDKVNIYRRNHRKLPRFFDCYTELARPMFIRTVHQDNDSGAYASGGRHDVPRRDVDDLLRSEFGVDPSLLDQLGRAENVAKFSRGAAHDGQYGGLHLQ